MAADPSILANLADSFASAWQYLIEPIVQTPWANWKGFWLERIFDDRFVVIYYLPLLPILLLLRRRQLRVGLVLTGLVFLAYVCGVLYAALWLITCVLFHRLGERFAIECKRSDVLPIGPPLAAATIVGGWYVVTMLLHNLMLPTELNAWLFHNLPWLYPLGARGVSWEPCFRLLHATRGSGGPFQLVAAMFWNVHNIGTAYLAVRMLHYLSEIKRDTLPRSRRTLLNFLAYVCYGPSLIQGPIERFEPFQEQIDTCHERRHWQNLPPGLYRIGLGVLKSLISTWYFIPLLENQLGIGVDNRYYDHPEQIESFWMLYFGVFLQIFWLYLEFSGYCDIAIGTSRLFGYRQVENFRMPWLATSLRDFWRRWHISLSAILRDYVYIALGGNRRHVTLNLCLTFFLCGIWHFLTPQVGIWGIVMGLMIAVNQGWVRWMKRIDENPTSRLATIRRACGRLRPLPQICAWLITQHVFVFSLLIFFGGHGVITVPREIIRRIVAWLS